MELSEFRESDEDEKLGQNAVHVHAFCLPGRAEEVKNSCMFMAKVEFTAYQIHDTVISNFLRLLIILC